MRLLLDTHVALWSVAKPQRLPTPILNMISDRGNEVLVSVVVLWEISIKLPLGRGEPMPLDSASARAEFLAADFAFLDVQAEHAIALADLPRYHGDPFDRMMVTQAKVEKLRLVTADSALARYSDTIITW